MKAVVVALVVCVSLAAAVSLDKRTAQQVEVSASADSWNYNQNGADWPGTCASGKAQSPINIEQEKAKCFRAGDAFWKNYALVFRYHRAMNLTMQHTGNSLVVPATADLGHVISGCSDCSGVVYRVKQFNFHAPSEHTLNGKQYDAELQIVHQKEGAQNNDDMVIVSILFYVNPHGGGLPHRFLNNLEWYATPTAAGQSHRIDGCVDLNLFRKEVFERDYFAYKGSLTTPGCDETVAWRVMATTQGATKQQMDVLSNLFPNNPSFAQGKGNNRAVQSLNDREVVYYKRYGGLF